MLKRHRIIVLAALAAVLAASSCGDRKESRRYGLGLSKAPETVAGMKLRRVEASCFTFNAAFTGREVENSAGTVQVFQAPFWITEEPVPYSLVASVLKRQGPFSFDDMEKFLDRLFKQTRVPFVVASESMLEAAIWQDAIALEGSCVVSDDWTDEMAPSELSSNWRYVQKGTSEKTVRGLFERKHIERFRRSDRNAFYLAVLSVEPVPESLKKQFDPKEPTMPPVAVNLQKRTYEVGGVAFSMLPVEGGHMTVGGTKEQERYAEGDEAPVMEMDFRDFLIGETEVTEALWQAVMGYLPAWNDRHDLEKPVVGVSWYDTKEFIQRLNEMTGERFRLPGEYEWEYAARGGRKSRGYVLSGGNPPAEVGVYTTEKKNGRMAPVGSMRPNELGIYDMSGNAWEWVQGVYPDGSCVLRGGSCASRSAACRVSNRQSMPAGQIKDTFGFRIAL